MSRAAADEAQPQKGTLGQGNARGFEHYNVVASAFQNLKWHKAAIHGV